MSKVHGRSFAVSPFRRLVIDLMHTSQQVPTVTIERRMSLGALLEARNRCMQKPTWTAMFMKAYALVARERPLLRTSYMSFPWPRFYEHAKNIVCVNFSQKYQGEDIVLQTQIRSPENRSLREIDGIIRQMKEQPVEQCDAFNRAMKLAWWPRPIRRFIFWATMNVFGRRRAHNLGTFGITSVAEKGAGALSILPLITSTLHYGLLDANGNLDVRLSFDHRVLDGAPAAEALPSLERTLLGEILDEVRSMSPTIMAPKLAA
jgi:hypothetical protein